ncbi:MAG: hypothetical protein RL240_917 [Planctomycetota bacterium]
MVSKQYVEIAIGLEPYPIVLPRSCEPSHFVLQFQTSFVVHGGMC